MKLSHLGSIILRYLTLHIELQLFITLICLPFLILGGLPLSLLCVVGNLFFAPLMTIFLALSTFVFITEIIHIPNVLLIWCLEKTTNLITSFLGLGSKRWLIGFWQPSLLVLILIPFLVLALTIHPLSRSRVRRISLFSFILIFLYGSQWRMHPARAKTSTTIIPHTNERLILIHHAQGHNLLIDNGYFNTKPSIEKFVSFELKPYLITQYGELTIDELRLLRPTKRSLQAAQELCSTFSLGKITIKKGSKELPKHFWRYYFELQRKGSPPITIIDSYAQDKQFKAEKMPKNQENNVSF